jgi:hypothetical protein
MEENVMKRSVFVCLVIVAGLAGGVAWAAPFQVDFVSTGWSAVPPPFFNMDVTGGPLTFSPDGTNTVTYAKGMGTHAPGLIQIMLLEPAVSFTSLAGVKGPQDGVAPNGGQVVINYVETANPANVLWQSNVLFANQLPVASSANLTGIAKFDINVAVAPNMWYGYCATNFANSIITMADGSSWYVDGTQVPEPMTMSLLALGSLAVLRRRTR